MKLLVLSLALLWLVASSPAHAVTLAWKFAAGDVEHYRLTQSARLTAGVGDDRKQVASVEQVLDLTWSVLEVDDAGDAKVSLQVTSLSLLAKGPDGQEVRYDSESAEEPLGYVAMLAPLGKRLAETPLEFTMNPAGEVTRVQLPEDVAVAVKSVPGGKKYAQDGGLGTVESLARLGAPPTLPEGAVQPGQAWSSDRTSELAALGPIKVTLHYEVAEPVSESEVTLQQRLSIAIDDEEQQAEFSDESSTGTIVFNVDRGRPETSVLQYEVQIEQPGGADGPLKVEQNTEFRRIADETQ